MTRSDTVEHLTQAVNEALPLWDLPAPASAHLMNVSENLVFRVDAPGDFRAVLRLHRPGYHSRAGIASELAWMDALGRDTIVSTPTVIPGRDGAAIQSLHDPSAQAPRFMVMFAFIEGVSPDETTDLTPGFAELGALAARCHDHALNWNRPVGFERLVWDEKAFFGAAPLWGDWRAAPGVTGQVRAILEEVETTILSRLAAYGKSPERFALIHADMRFANLLVSDAGTRLIDFDDCGQGWLMYDFAAAISFIEDDPRVPEFQAAWLRGYRSVRPLDAADEAEIGTMIMLRRMALLAWIGSHIAAPEPQALAPDFASTSARLGQAWLHMVQG